MHSLLSSSGIVAAAAGVCCDVCVGMSRTRAESAQGPFSEAALGAETTCHPQGSLLFRLQAKNPNHCHVGSKHTPFSSSTPSLKDAKKGGKMCILIPH